MNIAKNVVQQRLRLPRVAQILDALLELSEATAVARVVSSLLDSSAAVAAILVSRGGRLPAGRRRGDNRIAVQADKSPLFVVVDNIPDTSARLSGDFR